MAMCYMYRPLPVCEPHSPQDYLFFFFNDPPPTEIYTLSLHDALPIFREHDRHQHAAQDAESESGQRDTRQFAGHEQRGRSEEHTSELQSPDHLVCRLLLEKKKTVIDSDCSSISAGMRRASAQGCCLRY